MKKLQDYLQQLGISEIEARIYEGLLEIGPTSVKGLAEHVGIKRITAHFNIENLIKLGLVSETRSGSRRQVVAEPPSRLSYLVEKKVDEVKQLQEKLPDLINSVYLTLPKKEVQDVDVKYYTGRENIAHLYDEILTAPVIKAYVDSEEIGKAFPENYDKFIAASKKRNIEIWDLNMDTPAARAFGERAEPVPGYHMEYLPKNIEIHLMDYVMYSDKIAIITGGMNPSALIIKSSLIYTNAVTLFDLLWKFCENSNK